MYDGISKLHKEINFKKNHTMSIILVLKLMFTTCCNEQIGNLTNKDIMFGS